MENEKKIYQIFIHSKNEIYHPIIEGAVTIGWDRNYRAGTLQFKVVKDDVIDYHEGDTVVFSINGEEKFRGYVFSKRRTKTQIIDTLCYDSLRYLKAADTYQYKESSLSDLIKKICSDRGLEVGDIEDTNYKIPKRIEKNQEYLNMIKSADDITMSQTGNIYTLFDENGKICLKSPVNMFVDYPITYDNAVDFDYETSIDNGTYNRVVVYITDDDGNQLRKVIKEDTKSIEEWGVLEYTVVTNNDEDIDNKASQLLELFNKKYRSLTISKAIGNIDIRAGSLIPVRFMAIGDININSLMLVNRVTHTFQDNYHFMDLEVFNKDIMPMSSGDGIIQDKPKEKETAKAQLGTVPSGTYDKGDAPNEQIGIMMQTAHSMLGDRYTQSHLRDDPGNSDCSSFVWKSMKAAGFNVPNHAWDTATMVKSGLFKPIPFSEVREGDVGIFPKTATRGGHTVIALSQNQIIHQTPPRAVVAPMGKYRSYQYYRPVNK